MLVGPDKQAYKLHKELLIHKSPFFKACLAAPMKEQHENEVVLPEDSCKGFDFIVDWMYQKKVRRMQELDDVESTMGGYVQADKYGLPDLQNQLIDALAFYWELHRIHPSAVLFVSQRVEETNPLFRLVIHQFAYDVRSEPQLYQPANTQISKGAIALRNILAEAQVSFKIPMRIISLGNLIFSPPRPMICSYHVHRIGEKCPPIVTGKRKIMA